MSLILMWSGFTLRNYHPCEVLLLHEIITHVESIFFIFYSIHYERQRGEEMDEFKIRPFHMGSNPMK
jgi:hypothetical protein